MEATKKIINYIALQFKRTVAHEQRIDSVEKLQNEEICEEIKQRLSEVRFRKESVVLLFSTNRNEDALLLLDSLVTNMISLAVYMSSNAKSCATVDVKHGIECIQDFELRVVLDKLAGIAAKKEQYIGPSSVNRVSFFSHALDYCLDLLDRMSARQCGKASSRVVRILKYNAFAYLQIIFAAVVLSSAVYWTILFSSSLVADYSENKKLYDQINFNANILLNDMPPKSKIDGLSILETNEIDGKQFCWAYGPQTVFSFNLPRQEQQRNYKIIFSAHNVIQGQNVDLYINGKIIKTYENLQKQKWLSETIGGEFVFKGEEGLNTIVFNYKYWNGNNVTTSSEDMRPFALAFLKFTVQTQ